MQISLKLIRLMNHAKMTVCIKFQLLVTFSSLFTGSSSLSVFPRSVLYLNDLHSVESFDFDFVRVKSVDGVFAPTRIVEEVEDVRRPIVNDVVFRIASVRIPAHCQSHSVRGVTAAMRRRVRLQPKRHRYI